MRKPLELAIGVVGGLVVAVGVVVITASATGLDLTGALHPAASPAPAARSAGPVPGQGGQATRTVRLANQAMLQAEAQVLGMQPRELTSDLRQGTTVHQLADRRGISEVDFSSRFQSNLTAILDGYVRQGQLTQEQEALALKRVGGRVPNWDQTSAERPASPSPSPSRSPR
jgi:hypothetical protein